MLLLMSKNKSSKEKPKRKMGRRGVYRTWLTPESLIKLEGWARDGLSDEQISKNIGIHPSTLYDWKNKYNEISESLKKGKDVADREVENALHKAAKGYMVTESKTVIEYSPTGQIIGKREDIIKKHISPNTTAQIFWLKNRKPETWRNEERVIVEANPEAIDIHRKTLEALRERKVEGFNDEEPNVDDS